MNDGAHVSPPPGVSKIRHAAADPQRIAAPEVDPFDADLYGKWTLEELAAGELTAKGLRTPEEVIQCLPRRLRNESLLSLVPSVPIENVRWRLRMREWAAGDADLQAAMYAAAMRDPLFWFQAFMWLVEPRSRAKVIPFTLWPSQVPAILLIEDVLTRSERNLGEPLDLVMDKSRAQGASWLCLGVIVRRWIRDRMFSAGLVSRNMDAVDNSEDPDALMSKVDFTVRNLPWWILPKNLDERKHRLQSAHIWKNPERGGTVTGYSATGDVGSGGRKTVFMFDELAKFRSNDADDAMNSTQHVANCRLFVSTHKGTSGVYYEMVYGDTEGVKVILDWKDNPTQNLLGYRVVNHRTIAERAEDRDAVARYIQRCRRSGRWDKLRRRGFIKEGRLRSPWYDAQCLRKGATPRGIAQELDRDPRGTVGKVFPPEVIDRLVAGCVRKPLWTGTPLVTRDGRLDLVRDEDGLLKLWFLPGLDNRPPRGKYAVGADIATGSAGEDISYSALVGMSSIGGEQVLEYADPTISESRFARLAVALCRWLGDAILNWEVQGPTGKRFGDTVLEEERYYNVWERKRTGTFAPKSRRQAGWSNSEKSAKTDLFEDLWVAWDDGDAIPRSEWLLKDCDGWEWDDSGERMTFSGDGHGDRAIAGGVCWKAIKDIVRRSVDKTPRIEQDAPYGTLAWRIGRDRALSESHLGDEAPEVGISGFLRQ